MQHHHMQRMAFDPFAAIDQPAQRAQLAADAGAKGVLGRMHRAHLIGDRADAADPGDDIGDLGVSAALQHRLEEAGRFVDAQVGAGDAAVLDIQIQRAFAFDPGEDIDLDRPSRHDVSASVRKGSAAALKVWNARWISRGAAPSACHSRASAAVFGVSIGP